MKAIAIIAGFILLLFTASAGVVYAASITLDGVPSTVDQDQEFQININLACSGCSDSYLRGVFYPSGSSYFGYTQDNSGNWSNAPGGSCTTFFKVAQSDILNSSWSGTLKFKADKESSYYKGPGEYSFKVGRYTSSCSSSSVTWSDEKTIAISGPTSTPTPAPSNTPEPTSTNTPTPIKTLTPTKTPTPTTKTPTPTESQNEVLGASANQITNSPTKSINVKVAGNSSSSLVGKIFIFLGLVFSLLCGIVFFWPKIEPFIKRNEKNNDLKF